MVVAQPGQARTPNRPLRMSHYTDARTTFLQAFLLQIAAGLKTLLEPSATGLVQNPCYPPGPPAAILAKIFRLTPSEAKLASIIARGVPPDIAARELKISRDTARNQLKSVFIKTDTHRQSQLVALLSQVG